MSCDWNRNNLISCDCFLHFNSQISTTLERTQNLQPVHAIFNSDISCQVLKTASLSFISFSASGQLSFLFHVFFSNSQSLKTIIFFFLQSWSLGARICKNQINRGNAEKRNFVPLSGNVTCYLLHKHHFNIDSIVTAKHLN